MRAGELDLSLRQSRESSVGPHILWVSAAAVSIATGVLLAKSQKLAFEVVILAVFAAVVAFVPRDRLPALALATFALSAAPYIGLPRAIGSYLSPATLIVLAWTVKTISSSRRRLMPGRLWVASGVAISAWLAVETILSVRPARSLLWSVVFIVTVPLAGSAAARSDDTVRRYLVRTWTALSVILGAFATVEGVMRWNPLAGHFTIDGHHLVQKWSVYRVETTLGHPLLNAMFFATSAAVMTMLAIQRPTRFRVLAALLATSGLVFTASRTGVIGVSLGIGSALVVMTFSRRTSPSRKVAAIAVIVAAIGVVFQSPILKHRDKSGEAQTSTIYRSNVLHVATSVIHADGYLGSGPGTSQTRIKASGSSLVVENSVLQLAVSTGLPGVTLVGLLLAPVARLAIRRGRWEAFAGLIACVVSATGFNAWDAIPETLTLLGLVMALALTADMTRTNDGGVDAT